LILSAVCSKSTCTHFLIGCVSFGMYRSSAQAVSEVKLLEKAEVEENKEEKESSIIEESSEASSQFQGEMMETTGPRDVERNIGEMEHKFEELLRVIKEETLQLSEFLIEEKRLIHELNVILKLTLRQLNASFRISARMIPFSDKVKHIVLNEEGHLILVDDKGGVSSKALEDYPPEVILNVLWVVLPELSDIIVSYRKRISFRVNIFEKISREFRNLHKIFLKRQEGQAAEGSEETPEEEAQKDGVRQSLLSKK